MGLHYFFPNYGAACHFIKKKNKKNTKGRTLETPSYRQPLTGFSQYNMLENKLEKHDQQPQTTNT